MAFHAFLSYATVDKAIGSRLQRSIEWHYIPKPFRGKNFGFGDVPRRLAPIFRDRTDADPGPDLAAELDAKLRASSALVVVCSPASAQSRWVNEEIRTFKRLGREKRIFPVIASGEPICFDAASAPQGAFPPALFEKYDSDGNLLGTDNRVPLAADLRDGGDGPRGARLKLVAALTGIPRTDLELRQAEADRFWLRVGWSVAAGSLLLAAAATFSAFQAWQQTVVAAARLDKAVDMAASRVDDAARSRDTYGVPAAFVDGLLKAADKDFQRLLGDGGEDAPMFQLQQSRMRVRFSDAYIAVGELEKALASGKKALDELGTVRTTWSVFQPGTWFVQIPSGDEVRTEKLNALDAVGFATSMKDGGDAEARRLFLDGLKVAGEAKDQQHIAGFSSVLADLYYRQGDLPKALAACDEAIGARLEIVKATKAGAGDALDARIELATAYSDKAEMLLEIGRHGEALKEQEKSVAALKEMAVKPGVNAYFDRRMAQALTRRADMGYAVSGDWTGGITDLERAIELLSRFYDQDPARIDLAGDLATTLERFGDAHLQSANRGSCSTPREERTGHLGFDQAKLAKAKEIFEREFRLRDLVAKRMPTNADARRNLGIAHERRGEVYLAQRSFAGALEDFEMSLRLRPCPEDGSDAVCERDKAVMLSKVGLARWRASRRDWAGPLQSAVDVMAPLAGLEGAPTGWARDLAVFHASYGDALRVAGRRQEANTHWQKARALLVPLAAQDPPDPRAIKDVACLDARLKGQEVRQVSRKVRPKGWRRRA